MIHPLVAFASIALSQPPAEEVLASEAVGFVTALEACRKWILEPATWADRIPEFPRRAGLGDRIRSQDAVPAPALPPPPLRSAVHHWHVPVGDGGYFMTTSDRIPMCHIAGGGTVDYQPAIERLLTDRSFVDFWRVESSQVARGYMTSRITLRGNSRLTIDVTRAASPNQPTDRVQVIATVQYDFRSQ